MKNDPVRTQLVSDIRLLDFLAVSYAESCLTLLKRLNEFNGEDLLASLESRAYRYLPAMFCFRHYLELRLKYLYLKIMKTQFDSNYDLIELLGMIKQNGFNLNVFDEPIKFIDQTEKNRIEHFRYLITQEYVDADQLEIPADEFDKIKSYITTIEQQCKRYVEQLDSQRLQAS